MFDGMGWFVLALAALLISIVVSQSLH